MAVIVLVKNSDRADAGLVLLWRRADSVREQKDRFTFDD